ncbi:MAG: glycoside hydrolase family 88 protein, partial [Bryocella sp.]
MKMRSVAMMLVMVMGFSGAVAIAQNPTPTAAQQAGINKDISRHFGDSPADPGPIATDLSAALTPEAIDHATRKVADWQLARAQPYFDR